MAKRLVLLSLLLALISPAKAENSVGPTNQILCNNVASLGLGNSSIIQVITPLTSKSIFICGWQITNSATTGTFQLNYGTGTNCGTGTVNITPALTVTSTAPATDHIDIAAFQVPSSNALCITPSVNTIDGIIWYSQF